MFNLPLCGLFIGKTFVIVMSENENIGVINIENLSRV